MHKLQQKVNISPRPAPQKKKIDENTILIVQKTKYLGIIIDNKLNTT